MQKKILFVFMCALLFAACSTFSANPTPTPSATTTPTLAPEPSPTPEPTDEPTPVFTSDPYHDGILARRNGDYARAAAAFQLVLNSNPASDLQAEAQYRLAEADWLNNQDAQAIPIFSAYLQANASGARAPEARYLLADAYRATKDYASAIANFKLYRDQSPALVGDTDATIADVLVLMGDTDHAIAQYDLALKDAMLAPSTRMSILMRVADVHLGRNEQALAAARYDAAYALAGDARTKADLDLRAGEAYDVANQRDTALARWNDAINKYPDQPGAYKALVDLVNRAAPVDDYTRGLVDYYAAAYDAAIAAFERFVPKADAAQAGDARYFIASSHSRKGEYSAAIADFDTIIKTMPNHKRVPDAYFGKAASTAALGKLDDAVAVYKKFAATFPESDRADDALWSAALLYDSAHRYTDAIPLFEAYQAKYPARERAADALFWAGFDYYRAKDYKTAAARWQTLVKGYAQSTFYPRALFWLGKTAQAQTQATAAKNYWTQASAASGYYAWRAKEMLNPPKASNGYDLARYAMDSATDRAEFEKWLAGWSKANANGALDATTRGDPLFKRGAELVRLDRTVEARRQFAALIDAKKDDARVLYALALYLRDNNQYSLSMDCADKIAVLAQVAGAPAAPRMLWTLRYPTYYADLVVAEAQKNGLDPNLYFGLIRQESSFNAWITSSADARGLGQIVPATGKEIAQKLGVKNFSLDQLYLPYVSVRFGVWYFAQELKTWQEPIYAMAAYNAGAGRVQRWQKPDLDFAVEDIDIAESALYVRIVYANWKQYQQLYK